MHLTKQTDFAFRVLIYLTEQPDHELVTIQEICDFYDISANHIARVVMRLVTLGYVESVRGRGGGIRLARPAESIGLKAVVRDFESTLQPINCREQPCRIIKSCQLKGILNDAMNAFLQALEPYSLADLKGSRSPGALDILELR